jgi:hypothetical protein
MPISVPTFVEATTASAAQVNEAVTALKSAIEGINLAQTNSDLFQAGVLNEETDWSFTATINSATGVVSSEAATGGAAWLPGETSGFVRTFTASSTSTIHNIAPSLLPAAGKWLAAAVELAQSGSEAKAAVKSGAEEESQAEAEAHQPAVSANKTQVRMIIIRNNGGVYSIPNQWDVRSYATGFQRRYIATEQSRENVAAGVLGTPDTLTVVAPVGGLVVVQVGLAFKSSNAAAGTLELYANATSLSSVATTGTGFKNVSTASGELIRGSLEVGAGSNSGVLAAGTENKGGALAFRIGVAPLSAGTITLQLRYKASAGTVTAKERYFAAYCLR